MQPNLIAWLTKFQGPICPQNFIRDVAKVRKACGINGDSGHDILRHSFISAHVQAFGSFAATADQSGNTEKIIRTNYFNRLTTKEDALKFWDIMPVA